MSPRRPDEAVRSALIETAARVIADEGAEALTARRLASEVGTSTMAVYTYFGGMAELRREIRREGFARLTAHLAQVEDTGDTIFDLAMIGLAYYWNATSNPHLYRAMLMDPGIDEGDALVGAENFQRLARGVSRAIAGGRLSPGDPVQRAIELWSVAHGPVSLELVHQLRPEQAIDAIADTSVALYRAWGDSAQAAGRSVGRARQRAHEERHREPTAERRRREPGDGADALVVTTP